MLQKSGLTYPTPSKSGILTKTQLKAELGLLYQKRLIDRGSSTFDRVSSFTDTQDLIAQYTAVSGNFPIIAKALETFAKDLCQDMGSRYGRRAAQPILEARFRARTAFYAGDVERYAAAVLGLSQADPQLVAEMAQSWVALLLANGEVEALKRLAAEEKPYSILASGCADLLLGQFESAETVFEQWFSQPNKRERTESRLQNWWTSFSKRREMCADPAHATRSCGDRPHCLKN